MCPELVYESNLTKKVNGIVPFWAPQRSLRIDAFGSHPRLPPNEGVKKRYARQNHK